MKRGDVVALSSLNEGDRFYQPTDKKKTVYEALKNIGRKRQILKNGAHPNFTDIVHGSINVVFLRSNNPK